MNVPFSPSHIHAFASSGNNDVCNGIALCKNAHWLFDNGLWTLDDEYKVIVATKQFHEDNLGGAMPLLSSFDGQTIVVPEKPALRPLQEHIAWHRKHHFLGVG